MEYRIKEKWMVWIDHTDQIASFHFVDGYQQRDFLCRDFFMNFLQSLQEKGYRFQ